MAGILSRPQWVKVNIFEYIINRHGADPQRRSCESNAKNKHPVNVQQPSCEEIQVSTCRDAIAIYSWKITEILT